MAGETTYSKGGRTLSSPRFSSLLLSADSPQKEQASSLQKAAVICARACVRASSKNRWAVATWDPRRGRGLYGFFICKDPRVTPTMDINFQDSPSEFISPFPTRSTLPPLTSSNGTSLTPSLSPTTTRPSLTRLLRCPLRQRCLNNPIPLFQQRLSHARLQLRSVPRHLDLPIMIPWIPEMSRPVKWKFLRLDPL